MSKSIGQLHRAREDHLQERGRNPEALGGHAQLQGGYAASAPRSSGGSSKPIARSGTPGGLSSGISPTSLPTGNGVKTENLLLLDRWALEKTAEVGRRILKAYEEYEYHTVFHSIYSFFTVDLSAFYLDVLKDRLYCSAKASGSSASQPRLPCSEILENDPDIDGGLYSLFRPKKPGRVCLLLPGKRIPSTSSPFPPLEGHWLNEEVGPEMGPADRPARRRPQGARKSAGGEADRQFS